ncbi:DNA-3-methyladenine glycosylase I [Colwellia psychrerythraea]|uniref:DNA-3-methyladenine glycosylase I n=1 Tax=Colwellia psychrerythraea TaxID=28229 RepID=A0A099KAD0_COLPS|nr:DNA-3-methyladenine glycosylase I [Colwellia psychrerythraea]KGJ87644.1 DNA-3-methyladenine glycosylase I [Colwellia psychrerythraea]
MTTEITCTCPWLDTTKADYVKYHDEEWGVPVLEDNKMFEYIVLESAQAGLSWYTILKRRDGYRKAFANFDVEKVAQFTLADEERLVLDASIIRHKGKIAATVNNAKCFIAIQKEFGSFIKYIWAFVDNKVQVNDIKQLGDYPATSPLSDELSKDLKKRGFKFVGSTTIYAHLQASGLINDHSNDCIRKQEIIDSYQALGLKWQQC